MTHERINRYFSLGNIEINTNNSIREIKASILFLCYLGLLSIVLLILSGLKPLVILYFSFIPAFVYTLIVSKINIKKYVNNKIFSTINLYFFIIITFSFGFILALLNKSTNATILPLLMVVIPLFFITKINYIFIVEIITALSYVIVVVLYKDNSVFQTEILNMIAVVLICYVLGKSHLKLLLMEFESRHKLKGMSDTDFLTNLPNRRYIDDYINNYKENNENNIFMMLDIDDFKYINDNYGHLMGDELLKGLSNILLKYSNKDLKCIRYGGEEFLLIYFNGNVDNMILIGENIQNDLKNIKIAGLDKSVTLSGGISKYKNNNQNDQDGIDMADKALYYSKRNGKNKITVYDDSIADMKIRK